MPLEYIIKNTNSNLFTFVWYPKSSLTIGHIGAPAYLQADQSLQIVVYNGIAHKIPNNWVFV